MLLSLSITFVGIYKGFMLRLQTKEEYGNQKKEFGITFVAHSVLTQAYVL